MCTFAQKNINKVYDMKKLFMIISAILCRYEK